MDEFFVGHGENGEQEYIYINKVDIVDMWNFSMKHGLDAMILISEHLGYSDVFYILGDILEESGLNPPYGFQLSEMVHSIRDEQEKLMGETWKNDDYVNCRCKLVATFWKTMESNRWPIPGRISDIENKVLDFTHFDKLLWDIVHKKIHSQYFGTFKKQYSKMYQTTGNPDDYDLDKILEELGETKIESKPTKATNNMAIVVTIYSF